MAADTGIKDDLATHTKGIFRKKVSIATMLAWSKARLLSWLRQLTFHNATVQEYISKPMLLTHNKKDRKDALDLFKGVLIYMGDRSNKAKLSQDALALDIGICRANTLIESMMPLLQSSSAGQARGFATRFSCSCASRQQAIPSRLCKTSTQKSTFGH